MKLFHVLMLLFIANAAATPRVVPGAGMPLPTPLETARYARISTSAEISAFMHALASRHAAFARVESIGSSVQGRPVEVILLPVPYATDTAMRLKVMIIGS